VAQLWYGLRLLDAGRPGEGCGFLERARALGIRSLSDSEALLVGTGWCRLDQGDLEGAEAFLTAAVRFRPGKAHAWLSLAEVRRRQGRGRQEDQALRRAVQVEPFYPEVLYRRGLALLKKGDPKGARRALDSAVLVETARGDFWLALGEARWASGERAGAVEAYGRALEVRPGWAPALAGAGRVLLLSGLYQEAARVLESAAAASPRWAEPHALLAGAYAALGKTDRARSRKALAAKLERTGRGNNPFLGRQ